MGEFWGILGDFGGFWGILRFLLKNLKVSLQQRNLIPLFSSNSEIVFVNTNYNFANSS